MLEELSNVDFLLYVIDVYEFEWDVQVEQVLVVFGEIGVNELLMFEVYNKVDLLFLVELYIQCDDFGKLVCVWLLVQIGEGFDLLCQVIVELFGEDLFVGILCLFQWFGCLCVQLFELGVVQFEVYDEEGCILLQVCLLWVELNCLVSCVGWQLVEFVV